MTPLLKILIILILAFVAWAAPETPCRAKEQTVTLSQTLKAAFRQNPSIQASRYQVAELEAMVDQSASAYFPQVSNMTNYYRVGGDLPDLLGGVVGTLSRGSGNSDVPNLNSPFNIYTTNFFVSQRLYDFGRTSGNLENSQQQLFAGQKDLEESIANMVRSVKIAYFEVLKKNRLADVAKESLVTYNKHLEQAEALFQTGIRPRIDVTKSTVDRARSRLALLKAGFAIRTAKVDLENAVGGPPIEGDYALAKVPYLPPLPSDCDALIRESLQHRPEIAGLKGLIKAGEARLEAASAGYWPTVSANGGYGLASTEFPLKDYWLAGVTLRWELFSGFKTKGEEKENQAGISRLKAELRKLELSVNKEVQKAFIAVNESHETIRVAKIALTEAEENMALAKGRYGTGLADAIEFSDAETNLTIAKNDLVTATYEYLQNLARLEYAVGGWKNDVSIAASQSKGLGKE